MTQDTAIFTVDCE